MTSLTDVQREMLVSEIVGMIKFVKMGEKKYGLPDEFRDIHEFEKRMRIEPSDEELIYGWEETVGQYLDSKSRESDTLIAEVWNTKDHSGFSSMSQWQLDKILSGTDTDYTIPEISSLLNNARTISFESSQSDFILESFGMCVDEDGFIHDETTTEYKSPYGYSSRKNEFKKISDLDTDVLNSTLTTVNKVHIDDFGGIIHGSHFNDYVDKIIFDNASYMSELAHRGLLTDNIKEAGSESKPVLTPSDMLPQ